MRPNIQTIVAWISSIVQTPIDIMQHSLDSLINQQPQLEVLFVIYLDVLWF
jgi:hypothetical protein